MRLLNLPSDTEVTAIRKGNGFPGTAEKFRTLDRITFVNNHLQALAKNEGEMRSHVSASSEAETPVSASQIALSINNVSSTR